MLHQVTLTPTQRNARDVRARLNALRKPVKTIQIEHIEEAQPIPIERVPVVEIPEPLVVKTGFAPPEPEPCDILRVTITDIIHEVSEFYKVSRLDIISHRKEWVIVHPRQVAMYLARHMTIHSLPQIGRHIGGRDHTTVRHGVIKITQKMAHDLPFAAEVEALKPKIIERRQMAFHRAMQSAPAG